MKNFVKFLKEEIKTSRVLMFMCMFSLFSVPALIVVELLYVFAPMPPFMDPVQMTLWGFVSISVGVTLVVYALVYQHEKSKAELRAARFKRRVIEFSMMNVPHFLKGLVTCRKEPTKYHSPVVILEMIPESVLDSNDKFIHVPEEVEPGLFNCVDQEKAIGKYPEIFYQVPEENWPCVNAFLKGLNLSISL